MGAKFIYFKYFHDYMATRGQIPVLDKLRETNQERHTMQCHVFL